MTASNMQIPLFCIRGAKSGCPQWPRSGKWLLDFNLCCIYLTFPVESRVDCRNAQYSGDALHDYGECVASETTKRTHSDRVVLGTWFGRKHCQDQATSACRAFPGPGPFASPTACESKHEHSEAYNSLRAATWGSDTSQSRMKKGPQLPWSS